MDEEKHTKKKLLDDLIAIYYNGSFSRMACDYIRATEMEDEEVNTLLDMIKSEINIYSCNKNRKNMFDESLGMCGKMGKVLSLYRMYSETDEIE